VTWVIFWQTSSPKRCPVKSSGFAPSFLEYLRQQPHDFCFPLVTSALLAMTVFPHSHMKLYLHFEGPEMTVKNPKRSPGLRSGISRSVFAISDLRHPQDFVAVFCNNTSRLFVTVLPQSQAHSKIETHPELFLIDGASFKTVSIPIFLPIRLSPLL
jgi:hypothetical protein